MINIITINGKRYSRKYIATRINPAMLSLGHNDKISEPNISDLDLVKEYELICNKKSQMSSSERKWITETFFDRFEEIRDEYIGLNLPSKKNNIIVVGGEKGIDTRFMHKAIEELHTISVPLDDKMRHIYILEQKLSEIDKFIENGNQIMEEAEMKQEFVDIFNYEFEIQKTYIEKSLKYMTNKYDLDMFYDDDDIMSLDDFVKCCKTGMFTDNDGHGKYATDDKVTDIRIYPSHIIENKYLKDFPKIVWYNK